MKSLIKILLISLLFASCSKKVVFTSSMQEEYKFSEDRLKKVQFYTSSQIILFKIKQEGDVSVSDGKVLFKNKKDVEKIIIPKNTKCILEEVLDKSKYLFSFELVDGRVLVFGNNGSGCYSLMAKNWKDGAGIIEYANKTYVTTNGNVFLNIKAKNLKQLKGKERVIHGRKV